MSSVADHASPATLASLVAEGVLDAELAGLLWLLVEDGVPLVVAGDVPDAVRAKVAAALLGAAPDDPFVLLDAEREVPSPNTVAAVLAGGSHLGLSLRAASLGAAMDRLSAPPDGLPADAVRRLGVVLVLAERGTVRAIATHYLRPVERDGEGHVQRRPPAILATWDGGAGAFEHFAWGVTPELADRVDRAQADLEERQAARAAFLAGVVRASGTDSATWAEAVAAHLAGEPPREPAPKREAARPSPVRGLGDPHRH